jgi:hypothetical protein
VKVTSSSTPTLAPPGAGIPREQIFVAKNILLPLYRLTHPWNSIPALLRTQCEQLLTDFAVEHLASPERAVRRVLIPPTPGLEDNSRDYSLAMVLDHLRRVNVRMIEVVTSLASSQPLPEGPSQIADFKPDPAITAAIAEPYRAVTHSLADTIAALPTTARRARGAVPHPWFGPLTLAQWPQFIAMHQAIHIRQFARIRARL